MSALVALVVVALLAIAGLVVDGGAKASAARRAETAAAAAARAGADAETTSRLAGRRDPALAQRAAARSLREAGVDGQARVVGARLVVETRVEVRTTFLSVVGVRTLAARGHAEGQAGRR